MQVMFLWYHYFNAAPLYNMIRVYIAAYVWMTGFGNFSYYYTRGNYSAARFLQMQWRLNFLVTFVCLTMADQYMNYYICMLHTTFTVLVFFAMGIWPRLNYKFYGVPFKLAVLLAVAVVVWDVPGLSPRVFATLNGWWPLSTIVNYNRIGNGAGSDHDNPLHEWAFRSKLDHFVWIIGMACAYGFPSFDATLRRVESMPVRRQCLVKAGIACLSFATLAAWFAEFGSLDKRSYNAVHPYTSWIPILCYIVLRNLSRELRRWHSSLLAWLGKITLETYIAQFHLWLASASDFNGWGTNGQPKRVLQILPVEFGRLPNFFFVGALYLLASRRLFLCTIGLREWAVPKEARGRTLLVHVGRRFAWAVCVYLVALVVLRAQPTMGRVQH
jgi:hypothetical protein